MRKEKILFAVVVALFAMPAFFSFSSCTKWTEVRANDYFEPVSQEYRDSLKAYYASDHKVMFGWFGNWAGKSGVSMQYSLMGLPDSVDFVSLWLCWGKLTKAQQEDLKEFQERGSKAILCWLPTAIGENITPLEGNHNNEGTLEYWGVTNKSSEEQFNEAAANYARAIVDTCRKYNIDGFDADLESYGTLINRSHPNRLNTFLRTLREEFDKDGRMLVVDIPGGTGWLAFYDMLDEDVIQSLDYIVWQTYDLGTASSLDFFFSGTMGVKKYHPGLFEHTMSKSIVTATFERATDKPKFLQQCEWTSKTGYPHAGHGAYHIEYDYPGNPDYPDVRKAIQMLNHKEVKEEGDEE